MLNFYRKFIPDFSRRAIHLTNLTKENKPFTWTAEAQEEFDDLRFALTSQNFLMIPDMNRDFFLYTDASNTALGAVLCQYDADDFPRPIAFASKKLKDAETRYSTTEREIFAIVWAANHFKHYLLGREFTIFTDHHSLTNLANLKDPTNRLNRWSVSLANFQYKIKYISGRCNKVADFLSRGVGEIEEGVPILMGLPSGPGGVFSITSDEFIQRVKQAQMNDSHCKKLRGRIKNGQVIFPRTFKFFLRNDLLCCEDTKVHQQGDAPLVVIPSNLTSEVLNACHDSPSSGHLGFKRTLAKVRAKYFWHGLYTDVKHHVNECVSCRTFKAHQRNKPSHIQRFPKCQGINDRVHVDFVGPFNITLRGNRYVLAITDAFSRYTEVFPTPNMTAETITDILFNYISRHGLMKILDSDRGANFLSDTVARVCSAFQIRRFNTTAYHPAGNGLVERAHGTLIKQLAHAINEDQLNTWDEHLGMAALAYNTAVNESTGYTPSFLMYGRELQTNNLHTQMQRSYSDVASFVVHKINNMSRAFSRAQQNWDRATDKMIERRQKVANGKEFREGDLVFLFDPSRDRRVCKHFNRQNRGPFAIVKRKSPVNFEIRHLESGRILYVHADRLSFYKAAPQREKGDDKTGREANRNLHEQKAPGEITQDKRPYNLRPRLATGFVATRK